MLHELIIREQHVNWILAHRGRLLVGIALITVAGVASVSRAPLRVSVLQGLMSDESQIETFRERAALFGGDSDNLVYVATREGSELFSARKLNAIRSAARLLEQRPEIKRVVSIADLPRTTHSKRLSAREVIARTILRNKLARGETPDLSTASGALRLYWPKRRREQQRIRFASLKDEMLNDPLASRLLDESGHAHLMLIWLDEASDLHNLPQSGIREIVLNAFHRLDLGRDHFYCAGTLIIQDWMFREAIIALAVVLPFTTSILALLVYMIFQRLSYVFLNLVIAGIAIAWSLGLTAAVFGEITLLVAATPALILIISTADTIHLTSAYVAELSSGLSSRTAIRKVFREVGGACLLTSVTTLVGFLSLMVVPAVMVRQMAFACAVGVAAALLLALILVPIALTVITPPPTNRMSKSWLNRVIDKIVSTCRHLSLDYPITTIAVHFFALAAATACAVQIEFDADLPGRFRPSHPIRQSVDFFNREFTGTTAIEVFIEIDPKDVFSPRFLNRLAEFEQRLTTMPEVRDIVSINTVYRTVNRLLSVDTDEHLPESEKSAEAVFHAVEQASPMAAHGLLAREAGLLRVIVQVEPTRILTVLRRAERIEEIAAKILPRNATVDSSGYCAIVGHAVRVVLVSQAQGFLICLASVSIVVTIGIRSIRLGLLALVPNIFPLILLGGILALTFDVVDPDIMGIAIVSFGLAVDDTIHFLHRYDVEFEVCGNHRQAIENAYRYTGRAIVRTTVILSLGLLPFALSGYLSIRMMGTYLVFVLVCALLGDLLLLPALVLVFGKRKRHRSVE